ASVQQNTAVLPDYGFKTKEEKKSSGDSRSWPSVDAGKTVSGLVGGAFTLLMAGLIGYALKGRKKRTKPGNKP
ncbi:MAG: PDGLE domain-containing protein, partial [Deltaproteobacteria bacterium]|nr:PDGLE domain-containing protein [Deltaproteobacteria bacterium]